MSEDTPRMVLEIMRHHVTVFDDDATTEKTTLARVLLTFQFNRVLYILSFFTSLLLYCGNIIAYQKQLNMYQ